MIVVPVVFPLRLSEEAHATITATAETATIQKNAAVSTVYTDMDEDIAKTIQKLTIFAGVPQSDTVFEDIVPSEGPSTDPDILFILII